MKLNLFFCEVFCLKKFAISNDTESLRWIKLYKMITCNFVELCSLRWEALGWFLFYAGNVAAAFGSAYYHLKPDDDRLIWDRLPVSEYYFLAVIFSSSVYSFLGVFKCFFYNIGVSSWTLFECIRVFLKLVFEKVYCLQLM